MKFEYIGSKGQKDLDLVIYKVLKPSDVLVKGKIIEIPDELKDLQRRMRVNGNYRELPPVKKTVGRSRKRKRR